MPPRNKSIPGDRPEPLADEPECLITPEFAWYRPGIGFTCRQVMLPLFAVGLLSLGFAVAQAVSMTRAGADSWLEWVTLVGLLLIVGLTVRALLFIRRSLIDPLVQVRHWVSRVRGGEFSARMPKLTPGEFNALSTDINQLADRVESLHEQLEAEVASKTETLASKSRSLELLYEVVTMVNEAHAAEDVLRHFMHRLSQVFGAEAAILRQFDPSGLLLADSMGMGGESELIAPVVHSRSVLETNSSGDYVIGTRTETINEVLKQGRRKRSPRQVISIPLQHQDSLLGSYQLLLPEYREVDGDSREVMLSIGQHLGMMMDRSRLDRETTRLLMIEERTRLANELHDSLAQTLASLRFQVRIVDETLHQDDEQVTWEELEKLENQVEIANSELRELMGQFRAPLQSREIVYSIEKLIQRFRRDTGVSVFFQNEWADDDLSIDMRTHIIRIVQESLTNIRKHADANSVRVLLRNDSRGFRIVVEDDGKGYDEQQMQVDGSGDHIGRQIMQERADSLGAALRLESEPGEGSSVSLEYLVAGESAPPALASASG